MLRNLKPLKPADKPKFSIMGGNCGMAEHSPLGASSAERWLNCPKSYGLIKSLNLQGEGSKDAALGTAAHKLAEMCLEQGKDTWEFVGEKICFDEKLRYGAKLTYKVTVGDGEDDTIDANAVQVYLDFVRSLPGQHSWEVRLGNKWKPHPLYMGTADFVAVSDDAIHIVDYKNGAGIAVDPEENSQLLYYAAGAVFESKESWSPRDVIHMHIVQPRAAGKDIKSWAITADDLMNWINDTLIPGMFKAESGQGDFATGDWCRFCPAILDCPKQHHDLKTLNQADADKMTDEELDLLYPTFETVKMFMKAAEARLHKRLVEGATFQQVKLVNKRSPGRVWKEGTEALLTAWLGEDAYTKALISPAQAEKLSQKGKDFVKEYAFLPPSTGYNLVPASNPAPAANPAADLQSEYSHYTKDDTK
jgi:hypothetical protein